MNRHRLILLAALGLAVAGTLSVTGVLRVQALREEIAEARKDLELARDEAERLAELTRRLRDDPALIEKLAREEQGLARDGETILKFPPRPR